jgi:hypothetical protein
MLDVVALCESRQEVGGQEPPAQKAWEVSDYYSTIYFIPSGLTQLKWGNRIKLCWVSQNQPNLQLMHYFKRVSPVGWAQDLVTGDRHLLSLGHYQGILIVKARDFLAIASG